MAILMKEASPPTDFLEIEAIEFDRRVDLAYSAIPASLRIFAELAQVHPEENSDVKSDNTVVYSCIALVVGGSILQWILTGNNPSFGLGTILSLLAFVAMFFAIDIRDKKLARILERFSTRRALYVARLAELEIIWLGATASNNFHELARFCNLVNEKYFNREDKQFYEWWLGQKEQILLGVCGTEKIEKIAGTGAFESKKMMRSFRGNPPLTDDEVKKSQLVGSVAAKILATLVKH